MMSNNINKNVYTLAATVIFTFIIIFPGFTFAENNISQKQPIIKMGKETSVRQWLVAGPFPNIINPDSSGTDAFDRAYNYDYLQSVGSEKGVRISLDSRISFRDDTGLETDILVSLVEANELGIIDYSRVYNNLENHTAYALTFVKSKKDQLVHCLLGSDDAVKVWVNDELVHENYTYRATTPGDDSFPIYLKKGLNPILVKVINGVRGWGFSLSLLNKDSWSLLEAREEKQQSLEAFLNCKLVPDWYNYWDEYFTPGDFPTLRWDNPQLAASQLGDVPLNVRWFDVDLNEVEKAEKPGRYGYIANALSVDGKNIRRAGTLYCWPNDWMGWSEKPIAKLEPLAAAGFGDNVWTEHQDAISYYVGRMTLLSLLDQEEGAVLMSYLYEADQGRYKNSTLANPLLIDDEFHINLQKKTGGFLYDGPGLTAPKKINGKPATILKDGSPDEAGFNNSIITDLRKVCNAWFDASGEPFITMVARNGIIVYHEATGGDESGPFTLETATPMASITKLITGVTFAQFIQQDLIQIDDPVGKFFPDFPLKGEKALTLRYCFTHTSGMVGHESWGGVHNHRLENVVANQLDYLQIGKSSTYNGDGYDLAGRVMESVTGKSIFRVIHENMISPLGMKHSSIHEDLAFSLYSTAGDMGHIGQMLLNKGSYGEYEFFSPEVFDQILPKNLSQFYPGMDWDQGIGITWMTNPHPDAGKNGNPADMTILSKNTIGHGSATSAILRVDLDNGLVITQTRRQAGSEYDKYLTELLLAIKTNLK